jgi:Ca2+-binding RTX toxin-like protein
MVLNSNSFQDLAESAGILWSRHRGDEAISVSWLDYNKDGLPDLWISGHGYNNESPNALFPEAKYPFLYINNGDGTFTNLFPEDWRRGFGGDTHGTNWVDLDNDGDSDVFITSGGQLGEGQGQPNYLFINRNTTTATLTEESVPRDVVYQIGRSRSSVWFDGNGDGLLDFVNLVAQRPDNVAPNAYFEQQANGTFINRTNAVGFNVPESSRYGQLADLTGDGKLDLIIQGTYKFPLAVYDFSSGINFQDVTDNFNFPLTSDLPPDPTEDFENHTSARDTAIADFDGDGDNDIFLVRSETNVSQPSVSQNNPRIVASDFIVRTPGGEIGYSFQTSGTVAIDLLNIFGANADLSPQQIFIGSSGRNPTSQELEAFTDISSETTEVAVSNDNPTTAEVDPVAALALSPNSAGISGISNSTAKGIYIGYNAGTQTWEIRYKTNTFENTLRTAVESTANITNLQPIGFTNVDPNVNALTNQLWINGDNGQFTLSNDPVFNTPTLAQSTVSGDFDNDKDIDIYIANAYVSFDQPNILYENQGDGTFTIVPLAGGAPGDVVGPLWLDFETGTKLATSDFDNDGFLDIFAGSTVNRSPRKTYLSSPSQLFQNQGNSNNWILIDLQGTQSNRDGIGAQVKVTSGGTTQLREQNGGTHNFAQNDTRLHFGLAQDSIINRLEVTWSSGVTQVLSNVNVNQVLTIVEPFARTFTGDANNNSINGTRKADSIIGNEGNDSLNGFVGNDSVVGGTGADRVLGSEGSDTLKGDSGSDTLKGGTENDLVFGGIGSDLLEGNDGDDTLSGEANNDFLTGGAGFDVLDAGVGNDTVNGNDGDDLIAGNTGGDRLLGSNGNDTIRGGADNDEIFGDNDNDLVEGNDGDDILNGNLGNDTLDGGNGNDNLNAQEGNDVLIGGIGNDILKGGEGGDTLSGNQDNDLLDGEGGNDRLVGEDGNDTLQGGNGNDTLIGGTGSDRVLESGDFNFTVTNTQLTGRGSDTFSEVESVQVTGGGNANSLNASAVTNLSITLEGAGGIDTLLGGQSNDELSGGVGNDSLTGNGGGDRFKYIATNEGVDTITDYNLTDDTVAISATGFGGGLTVGILDASQFVLGSVAQDSSDRFIYNATTDRLLYDSDGNGANTAQAIANFTNNITLSNQEIEIIA